MIHEKIHECKNNPENSSATEAGAHIPSGFSMAAISFKSLENKRNVYRDKDCMKNVREFLREHAMEINNFKNKKMKLLAKQEQNAKFHHISREKIEDKHAKDKNCHKVWDHCQYAAEYGGAARSICNLK